jgi:hypothetical protein
MARTTPELVRGIIETDDVSIPDLTPFIDTANALVTELCAPVTTYDSTRLELIERWLSAHFYAVRDMRKISEAVGVVNEWYQFKLGLNLACTMYGQQAMLVDTSGKLAAMSKAAERGVSIAVGITHLGSIERDSNGSY